MKLSRGDNRSVLTIPSPPTDRPTFIVQAANA